MTGLKYKEFTEKIIGAAMEVHAARGSGFQEVIYQWAPESEFSYAGLSFARAFNMKIYDSDEED